MWQEIAGCQQTLTEILGTAPVWFRPPVGHHNLFIGPPLKALGLTMAIWNCRGFDGIESNPDAVMQRISRSLRPGSIVLLHEANAVCLQVLEQTLQLLQSRGLTAALPKDQTPALAP
jgi:peptidoglycan/xylan/chitin deacetylase (PgdA/CDA1 family)